MGIDGILCNASQMTLPMDLLYKFPSEARGTQASTLQRCYPASGMACTAPPDSCSSSLLGCAKGHRSCERASTWEASATSLRDPGGTGRPWFVD